MKLLQFNNKHDVSIVERDTPTPRDHQVLVEIKIVSTCPRWDIHMWEGKDMFDASAAPDYPLPPGFPGHEMAGTVRAVGCGVKELCVGDRVAALEALSDAGAYSQFLCYRESELIKLPDTVSWKQAVSFELLKCVMLGMLQFGDLRGKSMLVAGLGPAGILALQIARIWGCARVVGIDVSRERVAFVREAALGEVKPASELGEMTFDLGYDCVGAAASVQNVMAHTNEHTVIFGVLKGELQYGDRLWSQGFKLESYRYRIPGERERALLLDLVANQKLNVEILQTHRGSFTDYAQAVEWLKNQEALKVIFYPGEDFGEASVSEERS